MLIGYVRVSTAEQNSARQEVLMQNLGVEKVLSTPLEQTCMVEIFWREFYMAV